MGKKEAREAKQPIKIIDGGKRGAGAVGSTAGKKIRKKKRVVKKKTKTQLIEKGIARRDKLEEKVKKVESKLLKMAKIKHTES